MDGLASLAAAATIIGDYGEKSNSKSPNKRKVIIWNPCYVSLIHISAAAISENGISKEA